MRWISALRAELPLSDAAGELVGEIARELRGATPDLLLVFASPHYGEGLRTIGRLLREAFGSALLLGCSGAGVVGNGVEVEGRPALSLTAAVLPDVELLPFHIPADRARGWLGDPGALRRLLPVDPASEPHFILLSDPFSMDTPALVRGLDAAFPGCPKIGGLASGVQRPGDSVLLLDDDSYDSGAVGVVCTGDIVIDTLVAQGCKPVGEPMFISACDGHALRALDGRPALRALEALYATLDPAEQRLAQHSLFIGLAIDKADACYAHGDFLIRNLLGTDPRTGALAVGATLERGRVVQFHLRDPATSAEDLHTLAAGYASALRARDDTRPAGVLLFSCLGRGERFYKQPHHDSRLLQAQLDGLPPSGFFCNGEIGPVAGRTYVHGYTSAVGVVRRRFGGER